MSYLLVFLGFLAVFTLSMKIMGRNVMETIVPPYESSGRNLGSLMEEIIAEPEKFERNINENIRRSGERVWIDWRN